MLIYFNLKLLFKSINKVTGWLISFAMTFLFALTIGELGFVILPEPVKVDSIKEKNYSDCKYEVKQHINSQPGKEINYISGSNGKYVINVLDINRGEYSATVRTGDHCRILSIEIR